MREAEHRKLTRSTWHSAVYALAPVARNCNARTFTFVHIVALVRLSDSEADESPAGKQNLPHVRPAGVVFLCYSRSV